jgi:hypothetical protein
MGLPWKLFLSNNLVPRHDARSADMSYPIVLIAKRRPLKDQLVETWTVAAWEQTNNDGSKLHRFGLRPVPKTPS